MLAASQDGHRHLAVDGTGMTPGETVAVIVRAFPEIHGTRPPDGVGVSLPPARRR